MFEFVFSKDSLSPGEYLIKYYGNGIMTKEEWDYLTIEPDIENNPVYDTIPPDDTECDMLENLI